MQNNIWANKIAICVVGRGLAPAEKNEILQNKIRAHKIIIYIVGRGLCSRRYKPILQNQGRRRRRPLQGGANTACSTMILSVILSGENFTVWNFRSRTRLKGGREAGSHNEYIENPNGIPSSRCSSVCFVSLRKLRLRSGWHTEMTFERTK